jgi:type I restriction enzyme, S subunit
VKNEKGWEQIKCGDLFEMKLGKMLSAKNYKGAHLRKYLRNVNVKWGEIDLSDVKEMDF